METKTKALNLRRAEAGDIPALLLLAEALSVDEGSHARFALTEAVLSSWLADHALHFLLAEQEGEAVGFAMAYPGYDLESGTRGLHMGDLFVIPSFRRGGVGRALLGAVAEEALAQTGSWVSWTMRDGNEDAAAFYAAQNASPVPVRFMAMGQLGLRDLVAQRTER